MITLLTVATSGTRSAPRGARLNDAEFLARLYDLDALPSEDDRYEPMREVWQHTETTEA
jgi:hypothetical protein